MNTILAKPIPPLSEMELLARAESLSGFTIKDIASRYGLMVPENMIYAKGWIGQCLEYVLGATAESRPVPDFETLSIELKTLPLNHQGQPRESTYICTAPIPIIESSWETSRVYQKLKKVLWILVEGSPNIPIAERRIGRALLWVPSAAEEAILKQDWLELIEKLNLGQFDNLTAHLGTYLQIRPKASSSEVLTEVLNQEGQRIKTVPKGFYLRALFTKQLLNQF